MKLAILGTRGVPARYGGFETLAEELGRRLAERGHDVTVYGRTSRSGPRHQRWLGMRLVVLPAIRSKHLETLSHTLLSAIHAAIEGFDAVLLCNAANAPFVRLLQVARIPVALNVDGLERKRRKWGLAGRTYYRLCERLAALSADVVITDARVIERYYRRSYRTTSRMIAYGGDLEPPTGDDQLAELGLESGQYVLYVSRFEPENNPDRVVASYVESEIDRPLVMVGGAPYARELTRRVHQLADRRVVFTGPVYGDGYRQLLFHCRCYIHATEVGGTHPALVEAMGAGRPVLYYDTPENREVVGDAGRRFKFAGPNALALVLETVVDDEQTLSGFGAAARRRVESRYRWSDIADAYEKVLSELC